MLGRTFAVAGAALVAVACNGNAPPPAAKPAPPTSPPAPAQAGDLPPPARAVAASELAGDFECGPFNTKQLEAKDQPLLEDRLRVRFVPNAVAAGGAESGKLEAQRDGVTLFVGAREMYLRGDELFERRAAKTGLFGGGYETVAIPGRDGKLTVVAGLLREVKNDREMVALAHGWFLDPNREVIDVAVFASTKAVGDLARCRLFAEKVISTVAQGPRKLQYGTGAEIETKVSYATFRYRLSPDWILTDSAGIHDFARMHFRKRGVFPVGFTELQMALDSHPGDWASRGEEEGQRKGQLLGVPVSWHLTADRSPPVTLGAWTISEELVNRDHSVASLQAGSAEDRDEGIRFAESIRVVR